MASLPVSTHFLHYMANSHPPPNPIGYHPLDGFTAARHIQGLQRSHFAKDIIAGGPSGAVRGSGFLKMRSLMSGFQG
eukprot:CAMPEP_0171997254 /NCGR_PEP_ID=MMETSP1041-20130122/581_1 /TAXON_ID=464988 /ORGANISM="Hemiselmis andersenii, Strain CCMP439" /LENGTH=76 /DNA_ID=CAMNT_0012650501 /DNA_START=28 /DNA_END=258 /DNA_ORIENTATION=-